METTLQNILVLAILLAAGYLAFFTPAKKMTAQECGNHVALVGRVEDVFSGQKSQNKGFYKLCDPTGEVFVLSDLGLPQEKSFLVVWGKKEQTDTGRPIVIENKRFGTF